MGFGLALSLRRYMPDTFGDISLSRCILDLSLTLSGYALLANVGTEIALEKARYLRKELVLKNDQSYLQHLQERYKLYPRAFKTEKDMFLELLKPREFEEWIHAAPSSQGEKEKDSNLQ